MIKKIKAAFFGFAVGDALGVPYEFKDREKMEKLPAIEMRGYGTWNQPIGTWSDDSSLAFCLAESLTKGYDLNDMSQNFINWRINGYWGAHHKLFDIGNATRFAIELLQKGTSPLLSGGMTEDDNGNGSLMRILPILFHVKDLSIEERYLKVKEVSSITHAHFRSVFACFIYVEFALQLLQGKSKYDAYTEMQRLVNSFINKNDFNKTEIEKFKRILVHEILMEKESDIYSSGYVLHTLEASLWCLFATETYSEAVLKAVNLGSDTDTTACVTGGLAGLLYGYEFIPSNWIDVIARKKDIEDLCERFNNNLK
jgi:ADP-ribosyl-[dinitrogen reductase] hydrolase